MSEITKVRAKMFNGLVKDGTILQILKDDNKNLKITNLKELIDNNLQLIHDAISENGAYTYDDMTWSEVEQLNKFIEKRINDEYEKHWKNELNITKMASDQNSDVHDNILNLDWVKNLIKKWKAHVSFLGFDVIIHGGDKWAYVSDKAEEFNESKDTFYKNFKAVPIGQHDGRLGIIIRPTEQYEKILTTKKVSSELIIRQAIADKLAK